jgi:GNAT superfamily N-acetyltransferase
MTTATMRIERADASHRNQEAVTRLIDEASSWLRTKNTDQWARPWPTEKKRNKRIRRGLRKKQTWIVWDGMTPAATVTIAEKPIRKVWPAAVRDRSTRAVYVHRLVTARKYAGCKLGEQLIDWAGRRGRDSIGAQWIRIDVWSSNTALHEYYMKQGFVWCGQCPDPDYPSGALFQKPVNQIGDVCIPLWPNPAAEFTVKILESSAAIEAPVPV